MALFKSLFGKKDNSKAPKGFHVVQVKEVRHLNGEAVQIVLDVMPDQWPFTPGQYLNFSIKVNGQEERRSYSLCSGPNEPLSVAVKEVPNGLVSKWMNNELKSGDELFVSKPDGSFSVPKEARHIVAIAAGSGITPILSIAKAASQNDQHVRLFYGNKSLNRTLFAEELAALKNISTNYYLSEEKHEEHAAGRIDKEAFSAIIKADLSLLRADCFMLCGPEQMIIDVEEVLTLFGVSKDKIRYELFTTPVLMKSEAAPVNQFEGNATVKIHLDGSTEEFTLAAKGKSILEAASAKGIDAPYSCKGGVCSTCKAKVLKGNVSMTMNYVLTDREEEEGFVLTCQAHPASSEVEITYDC